MSRDVNVNDGRFNKPELASLPLVVSAGASYESLASEINVLNNGLGLKSEGLNELLVTVTVTGTMPANSEIVITPYITGFGALADITVLLPTATAATVQARLEGNDALRDADYLKITYRFIEDGVTPYTVTALNLQVKKKSLTFDEVDGIPQVMGTIYYVDKGNGSDTYSGQSPSNAFETIGAAIAAISDGDAIVVKAGTYTETGLDVSNNAIRMFFEIGVILDPASGTALTLSGDFCKVQGMHMITPGAGEIGLLISGDNCHVEHGMVLNGATGVQVTGSGAMVDSYAVGTPTVAAFDLQGAQGRLKDCKTVGNAATIGYHVNAGADTGVLENCTSSGHQTSGYYIDTLSQDWTILRCSSGAGDGRWADVDNANVWSDFKYAKEIFKLTTFAGAATEYNIFKVTGGVRVSLFGGHIDTAIPNTPCSIHLELYSVGGSSDISLSPGVDIDSAVAGALISRNGPAASDLDLGNPNAAPAFMENATFNKPYTEFDCVEDNTNDTYIRVVLSAALASGAAHWHCEWAPLTDNGFLEPA